MQSDLFKYAIETIKNALKENAGGKYDVVEEFSDQGKNQIRLSVADIFQSTNDKTGQRIIVDEIRYEVPAEFVMVLRISFAGKSLEDVLSNLGFVAVYFKDHNFFECGEYNWHGNEINKFFLEPIVRREIVNNNNGYLYLDYRLELHLNSVKEEKFVRVEKKVLSSNQIK